jgi:lipoprotein signal peptidase
LHNDVLIDEKKQKLMVSAILAAVIAVDQSAKWWAWRHVAGVKINTGGDFLVGPTVGQWFAAPVTGALLDLLDVGLLSIALAVLVRHRRPLAVVVPGALVIGGWASNLLDRLGMHYLTAPGSVRGAVDFIHVGGVNFNAADFFIMAATPLFVLAIAGRRRRTANRTATTRTVPATRSRRPARGWMPALTGAGLVMVVALGAAKYGGVRTPPAHVSAKPAAPPAQSWPPA